MKRESSNARQEFLDRLNLSEAIDLVTQMVGRYPNGGAQAGKVYIGSLAATLCNYPRSIAIACADLMTGVTATREFMPTPASIIAWCDLRKADMKERIFCGDRIAGQLAERARLEQFHAENQPKETWEQTKADLIARGFKFEGRAAAIETAEHVRAKHGITAEQWAAVPDLPFDFEERARRGR